MPELTNELTRVAGYIGTEMKCRLREFNPDTVTHPSTSRLGVE